MSFWSWSTGPTLKHALLGQGPPEPLPCPEPIPLKDGLWRQPVRATKAEAAEIVAFLRHQYDRGAALDYTEAEVAAKTILIVRSIAGRIIGTVSSRPLGTVAGGEFPIIYIDLFCVDATYREAGVGRDLLFAIYALNFPNPRAVFIKEGTALPLIVPPIRSSHYRWRCVAPDETFNGVSIMTFREFEEWTPAGTLYNRPNGPTESVAFNYRDQAVAVFTPAHQTINGYANQQQQMIWMTGYMERDIIDREDALRNLSAAASRHFGAPLVWVDGEYAPTWTKDGAYHIYAFNWNPGTFYKGQPVLFI